ncbi:MAG: hypothetical protein HOC23_13475 [Halieaceae bacterium]|jgi:hypothetical protein|nr:hypothetical protein [Halieaceae bacterium]
MTSAAAQLAFPDELLEELVGNVYGHLEKSAEGYYIAMSDVLRTLNGIPPDLDLSTAKLTDHDMVTSDMAEAIIESDNRILTTGESVSAYAWVKNEEGRWIKIFGMRQRTPQNTILGHTFIGINTERIGVWVERLDHKTETLLLSERDNQFLSRRELRILSLFVDGAPRKDMAQDLCLSVKSIEKALTRMRVKMLAVSGLDNKASLQRCLNQLGLTAFLLEKPDWFSDEHQVVVINSLNRKKVSYPHQK